MPYTFLLLFLTIKLTSGAGNCTKNADCPLDKRCFQKTCENPCGITPNCGSNAHCSVIEHVMRCKCPSGTSGNPYQACVPKDCRENADCASDEICLGTSNACRKVCAVSNTCGQGAECQGRNHSPRCTCRVGTTGDPLLGCVEIPPRELPRARRECDVDSNCGTDLICTNGACVNPCSTGRYCSVGQQCSVVTTSKFRKVVCQCPPNTTLTSVGICMENGVTIPVGSPPRIISQPPKDELWFQVKQCDDGLDRYFLLECDAEGEPAPTYKWIKEGKEFQWQSYGDRIVQLEGNGTLVFNSPKIEDAGQYQCLASNKWGTASTNTVVLKKAEFKPFKDRYPTRSSVKEGDPYKLTCNVPDGWPKPQVSWVLQNSHGALQIINSPRLTVDPEGTLWFSNVTRDDISSEFMYTCAVFSEFIQETKLGNRRTLTMSREEGSKGHPPVIQYVSRASTTVIRGSTISLWCIIGGTPLPEITWTKKDGHLPKERMKLENYGKTLIIENVDFGDQATYECQWHFYDYNGGAKKSESHAMLVSIYAVPYFTVEPEIQYPAKGETVEIKCEADGNPTPEIQWTHNGKLLRAEDLDTNTRRSVFKNRIVLENVTKRDTSNYGCNASNAYGYVYKDIFINVLSSPDDPDDEQEKDAKIPDGTREIMVISLSVALTVVIALMICGLLLIRRYYRKALVGQDEIQRFFDGDNSSHVKDNAYKMPYDKQRYEIDNKFFTIEKDGLLGSGEFGRVHRGKISNDSKETSVAIKTANPQKASKTIIVGLLSEIKILAYVGKHSNIIELLGANTSEVKVGKVYIFLELCDKGSLESHLRKLRPVVSLQEMEPQENFVQDSKSDGYANGMELKSVHVHPLDPSLSHDLYRWSKEICNAMCFLATKHVVHADLATRNILLNGNKEAKVCDFGLSRRMYNYSSYVKTRQEPLPWKWMAPESLRVQEFNEKTDVWSFGVTLWEMYSLGDSPYQGLSWDQNFVQMLERGLRLGQPQYNERDMYSVMKQCWTINPNYRPNFADLYSDIVKN